MGAVVLMAATMIVYAAIFALGGQAVNRLRTNRERMAITWEVSHPERLIIAYGKEAVTATDILYSADMFARTGINTYRKLFDLTRLTGMMPQLDMKLVGERMRVRATGQSFGPIALVVSTDGVAGATRIFQAAAEAERPVETFRDFAAAREWPDRTAPPEGIAEVDHD